MLSDSLGATRDWFPGQGRKEIVVGHTTNPYLLSRCCLTFSSRTLLTERSRAAPDEDLRWMNSFAWSTIVINQDYASKRHRDQNNGGHPAIFAVGGFGGGSPTYWEEDTGFGAPWRLPDEEGNVFAVQKKLIY